MADMLYKATKYMNAEDAMMVQRGRPKKKERQGKGNYSDSLGEKETEKTHQRI